MRSDLSQCAHQVNALEQRINLGANWVRIDAEISPILIAGPNENGTAVCLVTLDCKLGVPVVATLTDQSDSLVLLASIGACQSGQIDRISVGTLWALSRPILDNPRPPLPVISRIGGRSSSA